jgi:hypothetical protein
MKRADAHRLRLRGTRRRAKGLAAAIGVAVVVAGCGTPAAITHGPLWLVKVKGDYANIYRYPPNNKPGTPEAVELGSNEAKLKAAAAALHVPLNHITSEAS